MTDSPRLNPDTWDLDYWDPDGTGYWLMNGGQA